MRTVDAIKVMSGWDRQGMYLFDTNALALILRETGDKLRATIKRLMADGIIRRVARDLYVYLLSRDVGANTIYDIALKLRQGRYVCESFESAGAQWGFISQIPTDRVTVATTGRSGEFRTPYGVIEFTHVNRPALEIVEGIVDRKPYNPLPIASEKLALDDMLAAKGRCVELIDWEMVEDGTRSTRPQSSFI